MATYWEKLRDPRWQRKRLEVMQRAGFICEKCEASDRTLNVHHKLYRKGANPWEYADDELECLCEQCHEELHLQRARLDEAIVRFREVGFDLDMLIGFAHGMWVRTHEAGADLRVTSYEYATGLAAALTDERRTVSEEEVIQITQDGLVSVEALWRMAYPNAGKKFDAREIPNFTKDPEE